MVPAPCLLHCDAAESPAQLLGKAIANGAFVGWVGEHERGRQPTGHGLLKDVRVVRDVMPASSHDIGLTKSMGMGSMVVSVSHGNRKKRTQATPKGATQKEATHDGPQHKMTKSNATTMASSM